MPDPQPDRETPVSVWPGEMAAFARWQRGGDG